MSERKVLNKYYPPDFDPSNIPKLKHGRNRQYSIRIMAPFNMRCSTCGEYIYKGKKFNSRKETVEDEDYLGLRIFRFYIKCPRCVSEIAFKTDPQNTDYALEDGATRNFEAVRTAEILAKKEAQEKEDEEKDNPMKLLENRTKASQREIEALETLEDLKEINSRKARLDHNEVLQLHSKYEEMLVQLQEEEDEKFIKSIFGKDDGPVVKRLDDDGIAEPLPKLPKLEKPTDFLTSSSTEPQDGGSQKGKAVAGSWSKGSGSISKSSGSISKSSLKAMVKRKTPQQKDQDAKEKNGNILGNSSEKKAEEKELNDKKTEKTTINMNGQKAEETAQPKPQPTQAPSVPSVPSAPSAPSAPSGPSALGLLGNYSDSESSD